MVLGIWTLNYLIPPTDTELMVRYRRIMEGEVPQYLKDFPKQEFILVQYIIRVLWTHMLAGLGQYVIYPGAAEQVMVMTTSLMDLGYT